MSDQMPSPEEDRAWSISLVSFLTTLFCTLGVVGAVDYTDNLRPIADLTIWPAVLSPLSSYLIAKLCRDMRQGIFVQCLEAVFLGGAVPISCLVGLRFTSGFFGNLSHVFQISGYWIAPVLLLGLFWLLIRVKQSVR